MQEHATVSYIYYLFHVETSHWKTRIASYCSSIKTFHVQIVVQTCKIIYRQLVCVFSNELDNHSIILSKKIVEKTHLEKKWKPKNKICLEWFNILKGRQLGENKMKPKIT